MNSRFQRISIAIVAAVSVHFAAAESPATYSIAKIAWANALLDIITSPSTSWPRSKGGPTHDAEAKALIGLGETGWDETYKRFASGRFHGALLAVLSDRSDPGTNSRKTDLLLKLLATKNFAHRSRVPQIIAAIMPVDTNSLLRPFLTDSDPEVREAVLIALRPGNATATDIEPVVALLDDTSGSVAFQANVFLERATGHVPLAADASGSKKVVWSKWWDQQKTGDLNTVLRGELTRCANLLTNSDESIRERAGMALVCHSGQTFYGFHQKDVWWGVHNGERSRQCWLEWLRLRDSDNERGELTIWEFDFHQRRPEISLAALRATITMNIADLASERSSVRSAARQSIASLLGSSCPFRMGHGTGWTGSSNPEEDWLNTGIQHWWKQRMQALQE